MLGWIDEWVNRGMQETAESMAQLLSSNGIKIEPNSHTSSFIENNSCTDFLPPRPRYAWIPMRAVLKNSSAGFSSSRANLFSGFDFLDAVERKTDVVLCVDRHMVYHVGPGHIIKFRDFVRKVLNGGDEHSNLTAA